MAGDPVRTQIQGEAAGLMLDHLPRNLVSSGRSNG
jgi:hypothetical protein